MTHIERVKMAIAMTVSVAGVFTVLGMVVSTDLGAIAFSPQFIGLTFGLSYLVMPWLSKYIRYK
jgi:hypothetical protein